MGTEAPEHEGTLSEAPQVTEGRLEELVNLASAKEAIKDYATAADLYSQATELQAEKNGEMAVSNADLLYAYGRCLYHVAVSKSDVLGTGVPAQASNEPKAGEAVKNQGGTSESSKKLPVKTSTEQSSSATTQKDPTQPYFQFTGDENFDDSDEEDDGDAEQEPAEEEDEFANAFETLDLARILFLRKLEELAAESDQSKENKDRVSGVQQVKERLADTYDLQAEISLEGERFSDAVNDFKAALELKEELHSLEDPAIAECHYKLSLALEFASLGRPENEEAEPAGDSETKVDTAMRKEAEKHMESAIESCKLRISKAEQKLSACGPEDNEQAASLKRSIKDVQEIVLDMKQRLVELGKPPVSLPNSGGPDPGPLKEVIGSALEDMSKNANDLSSFVKKRKQTGEPAIPAGSAGSSANGNGKKRTFEESSVSEDQDTAASKKEKQ